MANDHFLEQELAFVHDGVKRFSVGRVQYAALPGLKLCAPALPNKKLTYTVIPTEPDRRLSKSELIDWLNRLENEDDVSHIVFRKRLLFCGTSAGTIELCQELLNYLGENRIQFLLIKYCANSCSENGSFHGCSTKLIQGGPYLWVEERLCPIYRLYEDNYGAFLDGLLPCITENRLIPLRIGGNEPAVSSMAVPSRFHGQTLRDKADPMAGKRILVKDIYDIAGLKVTACNKAYLNRTQPAQTTSTVMQRLVDGRAHLVGKARLSSMISREEPSENLDYMPPMNPRGDGKQSPAGSSSGSAAGTAAYDWIDFAIGSDSTGSTRRPAIANGVYGLRLTTGVLPTAGMMECFPKFDSPSVFARDIRTMKGFVDAWCNHELQSHFTRPTSIVIPLDYSISNPSQIEMLDRFHASLSACFASPIRKVRLQRMWEDSPPDEAIGTTLQGYLHNVGRDSFFYDFYHTTDSFRAEHYRLYHERPPVNVVTGWRWDQAENISLAQRNEAVRRLDVYRDWLRTHILNDENPIMILPICNVQPCYRDDPPETRLPLQEAWDQLWLAPILGSPEITVPVGQAPYESRITKREEWLPVVASILGKPKTDLSLIETAQRALEFAGIPLRVATGKQMWEEGWEHVERTRTAEP